MNFIASFLNCYSFCLNFRFICEQMKENLRETYEQIYHFRSMNFFSRLFAVGKLTKSYRSCFLNLKVFPLTYSKTHILSKASLILLKISRLVETWLFCLTSTFHPVLTSIIVSTATLAVRVRESAMLVVIRSLILMSILSNRLRWSFFWWWRRCLMRVERNRRSVEIWLLLLLKEEEKIQDYFRLKSEHLKIFIKFYSKKTKFKFW